MAFYDDMQAMVRELLDPNELGQGAITIRREVAGVPSPSQPWVPVGPTVTDEAVDQVGIVKAEYRSGETVIATDSAYMIVPPKSFTVAVGDRVLVRGVDVGEIVHVTGVKSLDVQVYAEIYVNK